MSERGVGLAWMPAVLSEISRWRGRSVVVSVSGGADSVGLLRVFDEARRRVGIEVSVAHLDHGVRGEAAREDARFVETLANSLGLPVEVGTWAPAKGMSDFEAQARKARYEWLVSVARARGASAVAVGHTLDDQAETILHRIIRGTGPKGLGGMRDRRKLSDGLWLIRPFLGVRRDEIRAYLGAIGQSWREDATNEDLGRSRARIRWQVLPELASTLNPRVAEALVRLGKLSGEERRTLDALLNRLERRVGVTEEGGKWTVDLGKLEKWPAQVRTQVLRRIWGRSGRSERGMSARHWRELGRLSGRNTREGGLSWNLPGGLVAEREETRLVVRPAVGGAEVVEDEEVRLSIPGAVRWRKAALRAGYEEEISGECVDADVIDPFGEEAAPFLVVRAPREGDRFDPLGMGGHSMVLGDFLRGRRVGREERGQVAVVWDRRGIVWVAGHRIAERVKRTEGTRREMRLGFEREE